MNLENLKPGDMIYAATDVINDGSLPGVDSEALIAVAGTRGVLVNTGHLEEEPEMLLFLVGPAVACWAEELCVEPPN